MTLRKTLITLIFVSMLSSCAAPGTAFKSVTMADPDRSAVIYVYRPASFVNAAGYPHVYVAGHDRIALKNGGYVSFMVPPGETEILVKGDFLVWGLPEQRAKITVEVGEEYYVRFSSSTTGFITPVYVGKRLHLGEVDRETGLAEISKAKESR